MVDVLITADTNTVFVKKVNKYIVRFHLIGGAVEENKYKIIIDLCIEGADKVITRVYGILRQGNAKRKIRLTEEEYQRKTFYINKKDKDIPFDVEFYLEYRVGQNKYETFKEVIKNCKINVFEF